MAKFEELTEKLREIFQIDRPDLDFGIYRIIGARRAEIDDFLTNRLKAKVQAALAKGAAADLADTKAELEKLTATLSAAGVDPDTSPKVAALKAQLAAADTSARENAVFSHLLTFFSRYYDKGDFISQRRYKGDTYAIPYSGEEVVLHWANKDQYYTKSGELFANYGFTLSKGPMAGKRVLFKLVAADTAKDNRKSADKNWAYALASARTVTSQDDEGETVETEIVPVSVEGDELVIRFEYGPQGKGVKQADLLAAAAEAVMADPVAANWWESLREPAPTEGNKNRTLLEKHLTDYAAKNTADYFIHKDLGGFLRRELDFYIKAEVMRLDDIQQAEAFEGIAANLRMIQCLREIALDIITFLAQIEDFQKKLWLKKKFVVSAHWCVTLDRVPSLHERIAANPRQWQAWRDLGVWEGADGTVADLTKRPYMIVDTSLFEAAFRADLLKQLPQLDKSTNGLVINADNASALSLISRRFQSSIDVIYVDPPYNTDAGPIIYKNGYKSSSWCSMIENRFSLGKNLLSEVGIQISLIDDYQYKEMDYIIQSIFGSEMVLGRVVIRANPSGRPLPQGFAQSHEYAVFSANTGKSAIQKLPRSERQAARYRHTDDKGRAYMWETFRKRGSNSERKDRPTLYYPLYCGEGKIRVPHMTYNIITKSWDVLEDPKENEAVIYPIDENGLERTWRAKPENITNNPHNYKYETDSGQITVYYRFFPSQDGVLPTTNWIDAIYSSTEHGTGKLKDLFSVHNVFSYPKSLFAVRDSIYIAGCKRPDAVCLDYFGGSGTTGHAVIELNREDGGSRKYILVEQGEYFEAALLSRLKKVIFSAEWVDGKPVSLDTGLSQVVKVLKIESYEDTLSNLALQRTTAQELALDAIPAAERDDYRMRYMLDVESHGSLLSVGQFRKPWDYKLDIATDSAGASELQAVDLIETFNYLLGLTVDTIDIDQERGFATVTGWEPGVSHTHENRTLIIWRDCDVVDDAGLHALTRRLAINPGDAEFKRVYVNGDHSLPSVIETDDGGERTITLLPIEPEFLARMWDVKDV